MQSNKLQIILKLNKKLLLKKLKIKRRYKKQSSKFGQSIPMLNMNPDTNVKIGSSLFSSQGMHPVKLSQVGRRSAVTKCSIDDENTNESDNENIFLTNYDIIMNSSELLSGEHGLCYIKCARCDLRLEYYNEDALGSLIVCCSTIVHRESSLAAPLILDMVGATIRYSAIKKYLKNQRIFSKFH